MNKALIAVVAVVVILLGLAGVGYFYQTHHYVERNQWRNLQGEAQFDRYDFAERFLTRKGYQIQRHKHYAQLIPKQLKQTDVVLFTNDARTVTNTQANALLQWIKTGGQVVVYAGNDHKDNDKVNPLFEATGLEVTASTGGSCPRTMSEVFGEMELFLQLIEDYQKKRNQRNQGEGLKSDETLVEEMLTTDDSNNVNYQINGQTLTLALNVGARIEANHDSELKPVYHVPADCKGELFSTFRLGRGSLTVYSLPPQYFDNRGVVWLDHIWNNHNASALDLFLQAGGGGRRILWFEAAVYPPVLPFLWQYWAFALVTTLLLLLAWIWRHSRRFGSLIVEDERQGLTLGRHLRATGEFYYRNEQKNTLLQHCYERLDSAIARRIPVANRLRRAELAKHIAQKTGLSVEVILSVLERRFPHSDAEFTQLIYRIHQIQTRL